MKTGHSKEKSGYFLVDLCPAQVDFPLNEGNFNCPAEVDYGPFFSSLMHPAMYFAGGEVYVKRIGFFEGVAQCMNTAIDEILWQENDLYKAALNAGVITTKLDKEDEENLRGVGVDEMGGLSKIVNPSRFIPMDSTAHTKLAGQNDPYMGIPGYSPEAYMGTN